MWYQRQTWLSPKFPYSDIFKSCVTITNRSFLHRVTSPVSSPPPALWYDDKRSHAGGTVGILSSSMMSHHLLHAAHASLEAGQAFATSRTHMRFTTVHADVRANGHVIFRSWRRSKTKRRERCLVAVFIPLLFEINDQVDGIQAAFILRSASALEGTQPNGHKVMRQQNRESPRLTGRNLCHVFQHILFLRSSSWSLSPSPSSLHSAAWRRRTTWIFWRGWYRKVSSVNLFFLAKSHPATLFQSLFCARGPSFHIVLHLQAPLCCTTCSSFCFILLSFAKSQRVREAGMRLCGSSVCADKWGDKYLEKKSKYSALITQGEAATVTRFCCEPQCKLYSPFAKQ